MDYTNTKRYKGYKFECKFGEIRVMMKSELKKILKKLFSDIAFEGLHKVKGNHSKNIMIIIHFHYCTIMLKTVDQPEGYHGRNCFHFSFSPLFQNSV